MKTINSEHRPRYQHVKRRHRINEKNSDFSKEQEQESQPIELGWKFRVRKFARILQWILTAISALAVQSLLFGKWLRKHTLCHTRVMKFQLTVHDGFSSLTGSRNQSLLPFKWLRHFSAFWFIILKTLKFINLNITISSLMQIEKRDLVDRVFSLSVGSSCASFSYTESTENVS